MIVPATMFIESAVDMLKTVDERQLKDQEKEFRFAIGNATDETVRGYQLGLHTMRILIMEQLTIEGAKKL